MVNDKLLNAFFKYNNAKNLNLVAMISLLKPFGLCCLLMLAGLLAQPVIAQELKGEVIGVAQYAQTYLLFPASVTDFDIDAKDAYICRPRRDNGIIIIPKSEELKETVLIVTEGNRTHQFIVVPRKSYDPNKDKLFYDYSTTKKLKEAAAAVASSDRRPEPEPPVKEVSRPVVETPPVVAKPKEIQEVNTNPTPVVELPALSQEYLDKIASADQLYTARKFDDALALYNQALRLQPLERYPKDRIETITRIQEILNAGEAERIRKENELQERYTKAMAAGDGQLKEGQYGQARISYGEALKLKPDESSPKARIETIDLLEADMKRKADEARVKAEQARKIQEAYDQKINTADQAFKGQDYLAAQQDYESALRIKPEEKYPLTRITDIKLLLEAKQQMEKENLIKAREKEITSKYTAAVAKGDKAMAAKDYSNAEKAYLEAKSIKPAETYPQKKIEDIAALIAAEIAAADARKESERKKLLDDKYAAYIAQADKTLAQKDYQAARSAYSMAIDLRPDEAYPKQQIGTIDATVAKLTQEAQQEQERQRAENEKLAKYRSAIGAADLAFQKQDFGAARKKYEEALVFKQGDAFATQKIEEVKIAEKDIAKARKASEDEQLKKAREAEIELQYGVAIARADAAYSGKLLAEARTAYNAALEVKPNDSHARRRLEDIEALELAQKQLLAEELERIKAAEIENNYKEIIANADQAFRNREYEKAKSAYTEALAMKPSASYPKSQMEQIEAAKESEAKKLATLPTFDEKGEIVLPMQASNIPLSQAELFKRYPQFQFRMPPYGQKTAVDFFIAADTLANYNESVAMMLQPSNLTIKDSTAKVSVTLQRIQATGQNVYMKFMLKNFSDSAFLAGQMTLSLRTAEGNIIYYYPCYVTGFPYLLPGAQVPLVYVTRLAAIQPNDKFSFTLTDRLKRINLVIRIPGEVYISETFQ